MRELIVRYSCLVDRERLWNTNIHYHPLLLNALPHTAANVLDVGCGDGILSADLVEAGIPHVVALDLDAGVLARARSRHPSLPIEWVHGNILDSALFPKESFDAVVSVAALHHMDAVTALRCFAELVRPGGLVGVVGLAANDWYDWPAAAVGYCAHLTISVTRKCWEHSAPIAWLPPATYREMKQVARQVLPGVRYRRHLYGRYSFIWKRPNTV